jgi:hypothetical protein
MPDNFCKNCGSKLVSGASFCPECGTQVKSVNEPVRQKSTPRTERDSPKFETTQKSGILDVLSIKAIIVGLVITIIIGIGSGILIMDTQTVGYISFIGVLIGGIVTGFMTRSDMKNGGINGLIMTIIWIIFLIISGLALGSSFAGLGTDLIITLIMGTIGGLIGGFAGNR